MQKKDEMILQGTLISIQSTSKMTTVQIITDESNQKAIPEVVFYKSSLPGRLSPKTRVLIKGYVTTKIRSTGTGARFETIFVGESITRAPRALFEHVDPEIIVGNDGGYGADKNSVVTIGEVINATKIGETSNILSINCGTAEKKRIVEFFCFHRQAARAAKLEKGDMVAVYGSIRTNQDKVGIRNMKQDVVCRDLALLKKEYQTSDAPDTANEDPDSTEEKEESLNETT